MSWAKFDDQFPDHPKVLSAGPAAGWLFVCGVCYCARMLTDGFIPIGQIRKLADIEGAAALATRLVEVGLWEKVPGGFQVHDYLEYNPTAEKVKSERAKTKERVSEWRHRNSTCNAVTTGVGNAVSTPPPVPVPESPNPNPESRPSKAIRDADATRGSRLICPFVLPDEWREFAVGERPDIDPEIEGQKFADYWHATPGAKGRKTDWFATWRNYVRSDFYGKGKSSRNGKPPGGHTIQSMQAEIREQLRSQGITNGE